MKLFVLLAFSLSLMACDSDTPTTTTDDGPPVLGSKGDNPEDFDYFNEGDWDDDDDWYADEDAEESSAGLEDASGSTDEAMDEDAGPAESDSVEEADPWAPALDVTLHKVVFDESLKAPNYQYPSTGTGFNLGGTEFWQKWPGGENPTYSFLDGTEYGRRCMLASAKRFQAIMSEPSEALKNLKLSSNWSGSFFNWNDDYSLSDWGDGSSARLWAWRTTLIKWISQTNKDGSCYLPTLEMVEKMVENCQSRADSNGGEIVGCKAP